MDSNQVNTLTIIGSILVPMLVGFGAVLLKLSSLGERITKLETKGDSTEKEIAHIKEDISSLKSMMQVVVSYLLGQKTGSGRP